MRGGELIREARKRVGLSQRELAERLGTTQAVIARWELGRTSPTFDRVVDAIRACGLDLAVRITAPDTDHARLVDENLRLTPKELLDRLSSSTSALDELTAKVRRARSQDDDESAVARLEDKLRRSRR